MERQDIDALLIGALYGELTPADEARLSAHLESHPGDRGALDDLKSARAKIAESRIFAVQADPPQHISALLLQEAHRRAPKMVIADDGERKDSWFWRFARSFALHPAMAAAAMLVVVLGVGALMYKNKGAGFANREVPSAPAPESTAQPSLTVSGNGTAKGDEVSAGSAAYEGYGAVLAEEQDLPGADQGAAAPSAVAQTQNTAADRWGGKDGRGVAKNKGIVVSTDQAQPKDFESERRKEADIAAIAANEKAQQQRAAEKNALSKEASALIDDDGLSDNVAGRTTTGTTGLRGGEGGGGAANGMVVGNTAPGGKAAHAAGPAPMAPTPSPAANPYAQPPPPPPASVAATPEAKPAPAKQEAKKPTTGTATSTASTAKPPSVATTPPKAPPTSDSKVAKTGGGAPSSGAAANTKKVATEKPAEKAPAQSPAPDPVIAWAKQQHARAVALVKNGDCKTAAQVALAVSQKTPEYYASFMASDRQLKSCKQYIDDARDREAEKSAKSRAQKRVNADEAAPANDSAK
jgi:hypothetical protein